ncbi:MAG: ATP-dependent DNA ligase [Chloroflexi bacterium]|nr:ATP-dependent DNA ligase [Chloroflexota bacterium]MCL5075920.1 ATP-dependent DNA ligase [Chloroflexota bacterium]
MNFACLVHYFGQLEETTSRNKMVGILAALLKEAEAKEMGKIIYLCQGRLVPAYEKLEFGIGESLAAEALAKAANMPKSKVVALYRQKGDYGLVATLTLPSQGRGLTISEVYDRLLGVATTAGGGSVAQKTDLLAALLGDLSGEEGKYLLRIVLGRLRLGIGDPTILDALSQAKIGDKSLRPQLERAYNIRSDLGYVAEAFWGKGETGLTGISVQIGTPVRPALCERATSGEDIIRRLGRCAVEPKYDGFRCQVHKDGQTVKVFSRNLEDFSDMFPEIIQATREQVRPRQIIYEGEAIAYDTATGEFLPFQVTVQRKRKYDVSAMQEKLPLKMVTFDLLYIDGQDYTDKPYLKRRAMLEEVIEADDVLMITEALLTDRAAELDAFFADKVQRGLEGIVAKRLEATYQAGVRNFNWIKLKRSYQGQLADTIDCVIIGYWQGRGMRAQFGIGSLLTAVYDEATDKFYTIAKLGTGLTEEEWLQMKEALDRLAVPEKPPRVKALITPDVWVEPKLVIEIQADEITRSPTHTVGRDEGELGYALRFPRMVRFIREDRRAEDATTLNEILEMYRAQGRRTVSAEQPTEAQEEA